MNAFASCAPAICAGQCRTARLLLADRQSARRVGLAPTTHSTIFHQCRPNRVPSPSCGPRGGQGLGKAWKARLGDSGRDEADPWVRGNKGGARGAVAVGSGRCDEGAPTRHSATSYRQPPPGRAATPRAARAARAASEPPLHALLRVWGRHSCDEMKAGPGLARLPRPRCRLLAHSRAPVLRPAHPAFEH